jgi:CO/xanthine dehydrogenase FAD-binding subunit
VRYVRALNVGEAVEELVAGAVALSGGTALVPQLARGQLDVPAVVDVGRLHALRELRSDAEALHLGAALPLAALVDAADLPAEHAALAESAGAVGNPLVRRVGTVGGNVGLGLPQADLAPTLIALDATVVCAGPAGEERHPVAVAIGGGLPPGRLMVAFSFPRRPAGRSAFVKFASRHSTAGALVSIAAALWHENGHGPVLRLAAGGVVPPFLLPELDDALVDGEPSPETIAAVAEAAAEAVAAVVPTLDEYRRWLVVAGVRRALARVVA